MRFNENILGAMIMSVCMMAYVVNDGMMKFLFVDIPLFQAIFLRGILTIAPLIMIMWYKGAIFTRLTGRDWRFVAMRVGAEVGATILFLTALKNMPLANVSAILQALPLAVTMAAALFLGAPVGWRRWSAILVGFSGVMIVIRPGLDGFSIYSLYALCAVGFITLRELTTHKLSREVPSITVALATSVAITIVGAVMMPRTPWVPLSGQSWLVLGIASCAIICGYLFSVMAMRTGEISFVAPFRYTAMVWAISLGIFLFGEWPDKLTMLGTAMIILTGIYSFHREQIRQRAETLNQ